MVKKKQDSGGSMAEVFGDIKPIKSDRLYLRGRPPAPEPAFTRADERAVLSESMTGPAVADIETGEELSYRTPGLPEAVFRKLRKGRLSVQAVADLHGMTVIQAKQHLRDFLAEAGASHWHCVRVIHGKGKRSGQRGPVLKNKVNQWLRQWSQVLAFCSARPAEGGTGAVYVLLRKR